MHFPLIAGALMLSSLSWAAPTSDAATRFTYYEMPTKLAGPCDLCTGPDGAIWVQDILVNKVARIDPWTGKVEEYDIPYPGPPISNRTSSGCAIQPGADGNLYATTGIRNQLLKINPWTKKIDIFTPEPILIGNLQPLNDIWTGKDGIYFSQDTANLLTHFDFKTHKFTNYPLPTLNSMPIGMRTAPDGSLWVVESASAKIARFDTVAKKFTNEYQTPAGTILPTVMRALTDNEYLWFTNTLSNSLGRISTKDGSIKTFVNPTPLTVPIEDTNDANGNVWYSSGTQNSLFYYKPSTGKYVTVEQPGGVVYQPLAVPPALDIAVHYGPRNSIWFTELLNNRVGRYQLTGDE